MGICTDPAWQPVCQGATAEPTSLGASLLTEAFTSLADGLGSVAEFLLEGTWALMSATTLVDVTTDRFTRVYGLVFGIAVFVMLAFFLLQLITGMLRREPGALTRAVAGLAKSVLGSFVTVTLTAALLEIVDQICLRLVNAAGTSMDALGDHLAALAGANVALNALHPLAGALLNLFLGGLLVAAVLILWFSLLIRKALLLIAIAFAPLALAGTSWDATRGWVTKWAAFVLALILSKLVIVVILVLATSVTETPIATDLAGWADKLAGITLLAIAGFAPYLTYKAISFMGFDMYHAMSVEQEAKSALNRPVPQLSGAGAAAGGSALERRISTILGPNQPSGARGSAGSGSSTGSGSGTPGASAATARPAAGAATAGTKGAAASSGARAGAGAGAAGAGAAAGPVGAVAMVAPQAGVAAAGAGPRAGSALGNAAGQQADAAGSAGGSAPPAPGASRAAQPAPPPAPAGPGSVPQRDTARVLGKDGESR